MPSGDLYIAGNLETFGESSHTWFTLEGWTLGLSWSPRMVANLGGYSGGKPMGKKWVFQKEVRSCLGGCLL